MHLRRLLFLIPIFIFLIPYSVRATEYLQVAGLIDLRTTYSDGELDLESLVKLAKQRGFNLLFINDHDRMAMEYGLFPLKNILRKRVELNSINKGGAEDYLNGIRKVQEKYRDTIIIPGSETAPFYFWSGSYFEKNLTAHNHERRILTIGLEGPEDYRNLPILHNGFSTRYVKGSLPTILLFSVSLVLGLLLVRRKGFFRVSGIIIAGLSLLFVIDTAAFKCSPFDQYHGDQGIAPYQLLIDYVDSRGGLTFWNYPETRSGTRKVGPILVDTPPYPEVLLQSKNYTGFAALYGDNIMITEPGDVWDRVLLEYCKGERDRPVWGISTANFHKDGEAGEELGNFPTVFLVKEFTKDAILSALKNGKMYAVYGRHNKRGVLSEFTVSDPVTGNRGVCGDEIRARGPVVVKTTVLATDEKAHKIRVRIIRGDKLIKTVNGTTPLTVASKYDNFQKGEKTYYRVDAKGEIGSIISNPIFVTFPR